MNAKCYIDSGIPFAECYAETLSDGSQAWNVAIRFNPPFDCLSEKHADALFDSIVEALKKHTNEEVRTQ
jgi:hypothetical protein